MEVHRFCWPKGTFVECAESICVKIMENTCISAELFRLKEEEEEEEEGDGQIASLGDSCMSRLRGRLPTLSILTCREVVLGNSQLHKKAYDLLVCELEAF